MHEPRKTRNLDLPHRPDGVMTIEIGGELIISDELTIHLEAGERIGVEPNDRAKNSKHLRVCCQTYWRTMTAPGTFAAWGPMMPYRRRAPSSHPLTSCASKFSDSCPPGGNGNRKGGKTHEYSQVQGLF